MKQTQISFAEFAAAKRTDHGEDRAEFYKKAFKEREKKNAFSFGLDLSGSMFSLLWEHYENKDRRQCPIVAKECWKVAKEIAGEIIGRGCEPKKSQCQPVAGLSLRQ